MRTLATTITLALCLPAAAQENRKTIRQEGQETRANSNASVTQSGTGNLVDGTWGGEGNSGDSEIVFFTDETLPVAPDGVGIYQDGAGSSVSVGQIGSTNRAVVRQDDPIEGGANGSSVRIEQGTSDAEATNGRALAEQGGEESSITIKANGADLTALGWQRGVRATEGRPEGDRRAASNTQIQTLTGEASRTEIVQQGDTLKAGITIEGGSDDHGAIAQRGRGHEASIDATDGTGRVLKLVQAGEERNKADMDVSGPGHAMDVGQDGVGGGHETTLTQAGADHTVNIRQTDTTTDGEGNTAIVNQKGASGHVAVQQRGGGGANVTQVAQEGEGSERLRADVLQEGDGGGLKADIDQTGREQSARIGQSGEGGNALASIDQSTDGTSDNGATITQAIDAKQGTDTADVDQGGNSNQAELRQSRSQGGTGHTANVSQPGKESRTQARQTGAAHLVNAAQAGNANEATLDQSGLGGHVGDVDQNGTRNAAQLNQRGDGGAQEAAIDQSTEGTQRNEANIEQTGDRGLNVADIDQAGRKHAASIVQGDESGEGDENDEGSRGTGHTATITQEGKGSEGSIEQTGAAMKASIALAGRSQSATIRQSGTTASEAAVTANEAGRENVGTIEQRTGGNTAAIDQAGANNEASVTQSNGDPSAATNTADLDQGGGSQNVADVTQEGPGAGRDAIVRQDGNQLETTLTLGGKGNGVKSLVEQTGTQNRLDATHVADEEGTLSSVFKQTGSGNTVTYSQEGSSLTASVTQDGNSNAVDVSQTGSNFGVSITQRGDGHVFEMAYDGPAEGGGDYTVVQE